MFVLLAGAIGAPTVAQEGPDTSAPRPFVATGDTSCLEGTPSRTIAPARLALNNPSPVQVRGLHVRFGGVNLSERPCYSVQGIELGWLGAAHRLDGVSVGLGNMAHTMRGVEVNLASMGAVRYGLFATGLFVAEAQAAGASVSLFKNVTYRGYGVFAGGWNDADLLAGWMIGALNGSNRTYGVQTGLLNSSLETAGLQIGLVNRSDSLRGVQVGLWNVVATRSGLFRHLPFLNVGW